ncbi:CRISPR-associated endonuclease Cas3'' [Streptacidiphilus neutrinimicus]|uniref:CRISPR-associated endonuclease Cas3'' n=1 Tax=Streptacidiphilus neutrinimicus TaxID=105420 RepID=UPI001EEE3C24|nr:CRISPR-associated endonuclease Cas3'' [Streptacidiphilus neutrinimicus]
MAGVDESLWGKERGLARALPPYPLVRHLLDATAMALHLWDVFLAGSQRRAIARGMGLDGDLGRARQLVGLCAGLHDIGKISAFQHCSARARGWLSEPFAGDVSRMASDRVGHDVAGMWVVGRVLAALGAEVSEDEWSAVYRVAEVVGGHHGRFFRNEPVVGSPALGGEEWDCQRVEHARTVFRLLGEPAVAGEWEAPAAVLVTGVVVLADWLVSQSSYLRGRQRHLDGTLEAHFERSVRDAPALLAGAGLVPVVLEARPFEEAFGIKAGPNPLQRSVIEELPPAVAGSGRGGILLVTAAPGDGKTETALLAVAAMERVLGTRGFDFLLPTGATSNQMYDRVTKSLAAQGAGGAGLTLVHSMAWLNRAYTDPVLGSGDRLVVAEDEGREAAGRGVGEARRWLQGSKRSLLAQFTTGTVDQGLLAVLPVRHNALRLLALSGKALVVDEAHAYDPYMQVLLGRLLNWLGAYGVPVVLLSATLPAAVGDNLVKEYLRGTGMKRSQLRGRMFAAPYPGWVYVDATGRETAISAVRSGEQARQRPMDLRVAVEAVRGGAGERLRVLRRLVAPVFGPQGGTVLIVCNTVDEAQQTYTCLRAEFDDRPHADALPGRGGGASGDRSEGDGRGESGEVVLLHARLPGDVREDRSATVTGALGKDGPRPLRRVVVATQLVEQSLDLDADLVVSDLAPMSLLLQRAGRCWRHEAWWAQHGRPGRPRPEWAVQATLVVLDPLAGGGAVPRRWGQVYPEALLRATSEALADLEEIAVPGDVPGLVKQVHGGVRLEWDSPDTALSPAWTAFHGDELAKQHLAGQVAIPRAQQVRALHDLHQLEGQEDEWEVATRLGAESVRLLCVFQQPDGALILDPAGGVKLPQDEGELSTEAVRRVMGRTVTVRADWFTAHDGPRLEVPPGWADHVRLGELRVLRLPVVDGAVAPVALSRGALVLDADLGLVRLKG